MVKKFGLIEVTETTQIARGLHSVQFTVGSKNYRALIATLTDSPHVYEVIERKAGRARELRHDSKLRQHIAKCLPHVATISNQQ
jgi:hypothetical protein